MSGKETLQIVVYDEELVDAIGKIDSARRISPVVSSAAGEAAALKKVVESSGVRDFIKNLPTITRAQRLLLTQVPYAREALTMTYRGKMLAGADPMLAIAVISIYMVQQVKQMWETIKQERISYENMLSEGLSATHSEILALSDLQTGYATWWDQFQTAIETEGFINAVKTTVISVLPAILQAEVRPPSSGAAPPHDRWDMWERALEWLFTNTAGQTNVIPPESVPME